MGCSTFSLILGLGTLVLKTGPNVSQKWLFYLTLICTPLLSSLLQHPQAGLEPWAMGETAAHGFSTMGRTAHRLVPVETIQSLGSWDQCSLYSAMPG